MVATSVSPRLNARTLPGSAASADAGSIDLVLSSGRRVRMRIAEALRAGLAQRTADGSFVGAAGARIVDGSAHVAMPASRSATGAADARRGAAPEHGYVSARARVLGMADGAGDAPPTASEAIGKVASVSFLTRGLLKIAEGPGMPSWQTVYFAAHGLNRFTGKKLLPEWLAKGPVKDAMNYAIIGEALLGSWKALPKIAPQMRSNLAVLDAARGAGSAGVAAKASRVIKASLMKPAAEAATAVAGVAATAAKAVKPNVPFIAGLFPLIKPLFYIGITASSLSGIVGLPEYIRQNGTSGMFTTTSGRGAVLGALSGAAMLASVYLPAASPLQLGMDFASNVLWMAESVNGQGWLDPLLGGDPKITKEPGTADAKAARPAGSPAPDASSTVKPAAALLAASALVPAVAFPAVSSASGRRRRRAHGSPTRP